ncbi:MAG: hypothetical protein IJ841_11850 [Prevotella sp.]|nr:hypothetical protein [Prevotella sp.]
MKQLHLIILFALLSLVQGLRAQEEAGEQLLVFRNTGVVDLLYTNEVDSILTNDSAQVFFAKDTVLVVPIAELDSVAVGSRNVRQLNAGARELTNERDLPWIVRFDGETVFYRPDTPNDILPAEGAKLFYALQEKESTVFPYGLCARVKAVRRMSAEIAVDIEEVELDEIFDRLFHAGTIVTHPNASARKRAPGDEEERDIDEMVLKATIPIPIAGIGELNLNGEVAVRGRIVTNVEKRKRYHSADLDLDYGFGFDFSLHSDDSGEIDFDTYDHDVTLYSWLGIIDLHAALGGYFDAKAELSMNMEMKRTYHRKLFWTNKNGEDHFEIKDANPDEPFEERAKTSITLDGRLSLGPVARIDFGVVGRRLGARAKLKIGPEIEGELGIESLRDMRNYQPETYVKGDLSICNRVKLEAYTINRHFLVFGAVDEHKLFEVPFTFAKRTWHLFPQYTQSSATSLPPAVGGGGEGDGSLQVDMATALPEPPLTDTETGFEILDPQGEVVDSVFVDTILASPEDGTVAQTFDTTMVLPDTIRHDELAGYTMRPVFHYAGYTVSAAPVGIKKDVLLQPYSSTHGNGPMFFISSGPFIGEATHGGINYRLGAYVPVPLKKNVYKKAQTKPNGH